MNGQRPDTRVAVTTVQASPPQTVVKSGLPPISCSSWLPLSVRPTPAPDRVHVRCSRSPPLSVPCRRSARPRKHATRGLLVHTCLNQRRSSAQASASSHRGQTERGSTGSSHVRTRARPAGRQGRQLADNYASMGHAGGPARLAGCGAGALPQGHPAPPLCRGTGVRAFPDDAPCAPGGTLGVPRACTASGSRGSGAGGGASSCMPPVPRPMGRLRGRATLSAGIELHLSSVPWPWRQPPRPRRRRGAFSALPRMAPAYPRDVLA
jgi:hypothetical protein